MFGCRNCGLQSYNEAEIFILLTSKQFLDYSHFVALAALEASNSSFEFYIAHQSRHFTLAQKVARPYEAMLCLTLKPKG